MVNRYFVKRIGQALFVFWAALTVSFLLYRLLPFGPVQAMKMQFMTQIVESGGTPSQQQMQRINRLVEVYTGINPDQPIYIAYINYLKDIILHLEFGKSIEYKRPVFALIFEKMPWSMFLSIYGLALGYSVSLLFGALMAHTEGSKFDIGLTVWTVINSSVPYYIIAIILIIVFGFGLGWFPINGKMAAGTTPGFNLPFMIGVVKHGALPIASLFIASFGGALAYRGNCVREKGKEYMRVGRLRGIAENRLAIRYVGRNSLLPIYTGLLVGISRVFGSSIIIETVFNYQAVGLLTFEALNNRDYPLLMGSLIFFTLVTLAGIFIADLTYGIVDPRVKGGEERETF